VVVLFVVLCTVPFVLIELAFYVKASRRMNGRGGDQ
jgi:hypothetical protein